MISFLVPFWAKKGEGVGRVSCILSCWSLLHLFCTSPIVGAHVLPGKVLFTSLLLCGSSPSSLSRLSLSSFYAPRLLFSIGLSTQLDAQNVLCCVHGRESSPRSLAHTQRENSPSPPLQPTHPLGRPSNLPAKTEFSAHALAECKRDAHCSPIDRAQI